MLDGCARRKAPGASLRSPGKQVCRKGTKLGSLERNHRGSITGAHRLGAGINARFRIPGAVNQQPGLALLAGRDRHRSIDRMWADFAEPVLGIGVVAFAAMEQGVYIIAVGIVLVRLAVPVRRIEIIMPQVGETQHRGTTHRRQCRKHWRCGLCQSGGRLHTGTRTAIQCWQAGGVDERPKHGDCCRLGGGHERRR